ncbi:unnamed protein product, partial [Discosporangium mesarthrocarpum]
GGPDVFLLLATAVFGMSSFLLTNGLWAQLPILYRQAPEGIRLPAYMMIALQLANVVPLVYITIKGRVKKDASLEATIYALLGGGVIVSDNQIPR